MSKTIPYNVGKWLPTDQKFFNQWLNKVLKEAENQYLLPPVQALKHLIESDRYIYNITQLMFEEIPVNDVDTPTGTPQVRNYEQMLLMLNRIIQRAPEFNKTGLVGQPVYCPFAY